MSASFTPIQTLAQIELFTKARQYAKQVYTLPSISTKGRLRSISPRSAAKLTRLTSAQAAYLSVPQDGPVQGGNVRYLRANERRL